MEVSFSGDGVIKGDVRQGRVAVEERLIIGGAEELFGFVQDVFQPEAEDAAVPEGAGIDILRGFFGGGLFRETEAPGAVGELGRDDIAVFFGGGGWLNAHKD